MTEYHEPWDKLDDHTRNCHQAIKSLMEELEAVDWYNQRAATCTDDELKAILLHNRDEEMEHAVMTLEWLRRKMTGWDEMLKTYLFVEGDILAAEEQATGKIELPSGGTDLGIGGLKA